MTTNEQTLMEYIGYLETVLAMQSDELSEVYELASNYLYGEHADELDNISTRHDTRALESHFAEVIDEIAKIKGGVK